jgi:hypothetical protein
MSKKPAKDISYQRNVRDHAAELDAENKSLAAEGQVYKRALERILALCEAHGRQRPGAVTTRIADEVEKALMEGEIQAAKPADSGDVMAEFPELQPDKEDWSIPDAK